MHIRGKKLFKNSSYAENKYLVGEIKGMRMEQTHWHTLGHMIVSSYSHFTVFL